MDGCAIHIRTSILDISRCADSLFLYCMRRLFVTFIVDLNTGLAPRPPQGLERLRLNARIADLQQPCHDQPLNSSPSEVQLVCECTSGISIKVNPAALPENSESIADSTLRSVQKFRDHSQLPVACKIEQISIFILGPSATITLRASLCTRPNETEFSRPPPDQVRAPVRVTSQQLAYCFSLSSPSSCVPFAQDPFILRTPYRTAVLWPMRRILELSNAVPKKRPLQSRFVSQYSFNRGMRAFRSAPEPITQYLVHLFRREKPEGIAVRCTFPTVCHGAKTHVER